MKCCVLGRRAAGRKRKRMGWGHRCVAGHTAGTPGGMREREQKMYKCNKILRKVCGLWNKASARQSK